MSTAIERVEQVTAMSLIQQALDRGAGIDVVERMVSLQREIREYEAKVAFDNALHSAQSQMKRIATDLTNPQTQSKYASYASLDRILRPLYTREGFSLSFNNADCPVENYVRVLCYVSREGHTRTYQIDMPADGKGAKGGDVMTKTHATGAAQSYGMRYLLKMIFNVAVGEDDDDGNKNMVRMPEADLIAWGEAIENASTQEALSRSYKDAYKEAYDLGDKPAMGHFIALKDKRKAELKAEAQ